MSNLRVIYKNLADSATVTASSTAGTLTVDNFKSNFKSQVHRSVSTDVIYTLTWTSGQTISAVVLPACNLTSSATITVNAYNAVSGGALVASSGTISASPGQNVTDSDFGSSITANLFSSGAASKVQVWLTQTPGVQRVEITINDPTNPAGFIDCSKIIIGKYWTPVTNADYGATLGFTDNSEVSRSDSGNLIIDKGTSIETMTFNLSFLSKDDRSELDRILKICGSHVPIFISLVPDGSDFLITQSGAIYGTVNIDPFNFMVGYWQSSVSIEGW